MMLDHGLRNMISRAKVQLAQVDGRTLCQVQVLDEDTHDLVEMLLPPGYVAVPLPGSDALELQIAGQASHKVLLGGDNTADAVANLNPGECGISRGGQMILVRLAGTRVISPLFQWGTVETTLRRLVHEEFQAVFNGHTHDVSGSVTEIPNQQMPDTCLTGGS